MVRQLVGYIYAGAEQLIDRSVNWMRIILSEFRIQTVLSGFRIRFGLRCNADDISVMLTNKLAKYFIFSLIVALYYSNKCKIYTAYAYSISGKLM